MKKLITLLTLLVTVNLSASQYNSDLYRVYDVNGRFISTSTRDLPSGQIYIIRYDRGYSQKIYIQ